MIFKIMCTKSRYWLFVLQWQEERATRWQILLLFLYGGTEVRRLTRLTCLMMTNRFTTVVLVCCAGLAYLSQLNSRSFFRRSVQVSFQAFDGRWASVPVPPSVTLFRTHISFYYCPNITVHSGKINFNCHFSFVFLFSEFSELLHTRIFPSLSPRLLRSVSVSLYFPQECIFTLIFVNYGY